MLSACVISTVVTGCIVTARINYKPIGGGVIEAKRSKVVSLQGVKEQRKTQAMNAGAKRIIGEIQAVSAALEVPVVDLTRVMLGHLAGVLYSIEGAQAVEAEIDFIRCGLQELPDEG